jgi:flagellin
MANIGATTAFYKVETSLTRANSEVSKSMERLATGKQNANAGDRSSYVAMADTFRLDYVGTKAGIKGASVAMGYLETGMRVLDSASSLLTRLQELAVLGANNTNTTQDHEAINLEAEALAEEFNRLMTTSTYKGKDVFVTNAASEYVGLGGRGAEMTFGIGDVSYTELYSSTARTIVSGPNASATTFNISHLPSDAVVAKAYGAAASTITETVANAGGAGAVLDAGATYVVKGTGTDDDLNDADGDADDHDGARAIGAALADKATPGAAEVVGTDFSDSPTTIGEATKRLANGDVLANGDILVTGSSTTIDVGTDNTSRTAFTYAKLNTGDNKFVAGETYVIYDLGSTAGSTASGTDGAFLKAASSDLSSVSTLTVGLEFTVDSDATEVEMAHINSLIGGMTFTKASDTLTKDIEAVQAKINTARVQAGSQYAALESAVAYTTDLTAQYELGYNTVNDVNFSMETAHLAKNQILQQAATAMLAQANQGQQSLLQLIQG